MQVFLEAHEVLLEVNEVAPDAHQSLCLTVLSDSSLHQVGQHGKDDALALHVDDDALVKHLLVEERPVLIGHASCVVEVALHLSALDVYLGCGVVCQILLRIVELVEDIDGAGFAQQDRVESGTQVGRGAGLVGARAFAVRHDLYLQSAVGARVGVSIYIYNVSCLPDDTRRS